MKKSKTILLLANLLVVLTFSFNAFAAPGDLDAAFGSGGKIVTPVGASGVAVDMKVQADGKIVALGDSNTQTSFIADVALVRYNADGTLDSSFGTNGIAILSETGPQTSQTLLIQSDGKYIVSAWDNNKIAVYRFNTNGTLDTTYGVGGKFINTDTTTSFSRDAVIQPDDKVIVVGQDQVSAIIFRLNANGTLDSSFNNANILPFTAGSASSIALRSDGKIVVFGTNTLGRFLCRFKSNGTFDTVLSYISGYRGVSSIAVQDDGKVLVAGQLPSPGLGGFAVARYNPDFFLDTSFGNAGFIGVNLIAGESNATSVEILPNGQIMVGGYSNTAFVVARFNSNGFLDLNFGNTGKVQTSFSLNQHSVRAIARQADGKIVAIGAPGGAGFGLARYITDGTPNLPNYQKTAFDYNGDRKADVSVARLADSFWYVTPDFAATYFRLNGNSSSGTVVPADYDGDGKTDPATFTGSFWNINKSGGNNNTPSSPSVGQAGDITVPGDFDGDGKADPAVFRNGTWLYGSSNYAMVFTTIFGQAGDKPLVADFDGDYKADFAVYRPSVGDWYFLRSSDGSFGGVNFGLATDIPVPADYDGDGKTDVAVYRPSDGDWYWLNSSNGSFSGVHWGISTDKPVPADYDGDGKADLGVFRPSDANWYILQSTAGFRSVKWGLSTDIPTPNAYVR